MLLSPLIGNGDLVAVSGPLLSVSSERLPAHTVDIVGLEDFRVRHKHNE